MAEANLAGVQALVKIEEHMRVCDRRYEEWQERQTHTLNYLKDIHDKLNTMDLTIAEARGAAKMGKFIISGISGIAGFVGGLAGHIVVK